MDNRTSYNFKEKENGLYINYIYENKNFDKKVFFQMLGIMLNYENLQKIIEEKFVNNKNFKEFLIFLNYLSENNFMELFFLLICSTLKYDMLKNNKFNFNVFDTNKNVCNLDLVEDRENKIKNYPLGDDFKKYREYDFNVCKCRDEDIYNKLNNFNIEEKVKLEKVKNRLEDKCQKILLIEMENFRTHLGMF